MAAFCHFPPLVAPLRQLGSTWLDADIFKTIFIEMVASCSVPNCPSKEKRGDNTISFHEIPAKEPFRSQWLKNISRKNFNPDTRRKICSLHFVKENYKLNTKRQLLKRDAIPTQFPNHPSYLRPKVINPRKPPVNRAFGVNTLKRPPAVSNRDSSKNNYNPKKKQKTSDSNNLTTPNLVLTIPNFDSNNIRISEDLSKTSLEDLRLKRNELTQQIAADDEQRKLLQNEIRNLCEKLAIINEGLAKKLAARMEYDKTITDTEHSYSKIWGSSDILVTALKTEAELAKQKLEKSEK